MSKVLFCSNVIKEIIEKIIPRIPNTNKPNLDLPKFLTKRVCFPEVTYSGVLTFLKIIIRFFHRQNLLILDSNIIP